MYELPCGGAEMYRLLTTPTSTTSRFHVNARSNPSPKYAHFVFNNFLNYVNGKVEDKNASTRLQRQRLSQSLINHNSPAIMELVELSNRQPIISLMLEFLLYMLEEGGERVEVLAFSAMRTYISNARNLIDVLWDKNILDFETADFDNSYSEVIKRSEDKSVDLRTPLSLFHKFLREVYGAPPSYVAYTIKRLPAMCRTSIVTPLQNEETWQHISSYIRDDGQISHHSKTFLYLIYNHAVRSKEAFGIRAKNVISRQPCAIKISSNAARSLKTGNSFRVTKSILASAAQEKYFNSVVEVSNKSPRDNPYLFDDLEIKGKLYPTWKIGQGVTTALRHISGNPRVVPYSMRHSAATRLVHWTFKPPRLIPLSIHVENTLKGSLKVDSIFELFDNGFPDWPFWVDSVGMHLGHAGTSTIANTYWHTSSVRLAEHTWHAAENLSFTDEQIANMLGRDRSTLSQQRKRLQLAHNPDIQKVNSTELVICHYINKSKIPTIGESLAEESLPKFSEVKFKGATHDNDSAKWSTYDRLLCERLDKFLTFEQTIKLAIRLGLNADVAKRFIDTYVETAKETEIFDFEPANSEILIDSPKQCPGVLHGAYERERRLTAGHRLLISNDRFREIFGEFLRIWFSRVKSTDPWFIARNESEFQLIIDVLLKLGAKEDQLEFCCCNFDVQRIRKLISKKQLEATTSRRQRLSKGSKATLESEIGINVGQISLSEIGDNRDTHRLILMLAAISRIEPF
jgi:integrase